MMFLKFICLAVGIYMSVSMCITAFFYHTGKTKKADLTPHLVLASLAWAGFIML